MPRPTQPHDADRRSRPHARPRRAGERFAFADLELDAAVGELRRGGKRIPIAPKPLELLLLLLRHAGRVVPHETIRTEVWPDARVSVATVSSTLRDLRRALGDDGRTPHLVHTIRGRGLRLTAPAQRTAEAEGAPEPQPRFVGRELVMARLTLALEAVTGGCGCMVLIDGEPGIGKTSVARALAAHARVRGFAVHLARCADGPGGEPYGAWRLLLASIAEQDPPGDGARSPIRALSEPSVGKGGDAEEDAALDLFDAVAERLHDAARQRPRLLVIDDLHAADRSSLRLLEFLAPALDQIPLCLLATQRSCEVDVQHPLLGVIAELVRSPNFARYTLEGLDREGTRALVRAALGREPAPERVDEIHARTDGNPLFVRELARFLAAHPEGTEGAPAVPPGVHELLRARIRGLPDACRGLLEAASILARVFSLELLAALTGDPPVRVHELLEPARRAGLIRSVRAETARFSHELVQEAVREGLDAGRRRALHRRAGELLAGALGDPLHDRWFRVARHLAEDAEGVGMPAVDAAVRAAEEARRRLAFDDQAAACAQAVALLERVAPDDRRRRLELLLSEAHAWRRARDVAQMTARAREAGDLARALGDPVRMAEAALVMGDQMELGRGELSARLEEAIDALGSTQGALRVRLLCALSHQLRYGGQAERCVACVEEAMRLAAAGGDAEGMAIARLAGVDRSGPPGPVAPRLPALGQVVAWARAAARPRLEVAARAARTGCFLEAGAVEEAEREIEAVARLVQTRHVRSFAAAPLHWRSLRALLEGRFDDALATAGEAREMLRRVASFNAELIHLAQLAAVSLESDRLDLLDRRARAERSDTRPNLMTPVGRAHLTLVAALIGRRREAERGLAWLAADDWAVLRVDANFLVTASYGAELCALLGATAPAEGLLALLSPYGGHVAVFGYVLICRGSVARYLAIAARAAGRLDEAVGYGEQAVAANDALGARPQAARARLGLAEALLARGDPADRERARALRAQARDAASALGIASLVALADALASAAS